MTWYSRLGVPDGLFPCKDFNYSFPCFPAFLRDRSTGSWAQEVFFLFFRATLPAFSFFSFSRVSMVAFFSASRSSIFLSRGQGTGWKSVMAF